MNRHIIALILCLQAFTAIAQHDVPVTNSFIISGSVKQKVTFTVEQLMQMKQDNLGDIVIRNKKGEEKDKGVNLKGVLLKTVLDSAHVYAEKHKEYSELCIILTASDGYCNVYSWNEIFNTEVGDHIYIVTEMDGKKIADMPQRILVMSLADLNSGRRHLKGLAQIEVKKVR